MAFYLSVDWNSNIFIQHCVWLQRAEKQWSTFGVRLCLNLFNPWKWSAWQTLQDWKQRPLGIIETEPMAGGGPHKKKKNLLGSKQKCSSKHTEYALTLNRWTSSHKLELQLIIIIKVKIKTNEIKQCKLNVSASEPRLDCFEVFACSTSSGH